MKKKSQLLAVLAVGLLAGPITAQAQYDFQEIAYPGRTQTQVFGINDSGDVVANSFVPDTFPFVYASMDGALTDIAPADGYLETSVLGINDAGVMVGSVSNLDGTRSGFIRSKDGTYTVFSHPDALSFTNPRAVNNKGLVTGFRDVLDGTRVGFIYDPKRETFTDIVPSLFTIAQGISSKGDVVGSAIFDVNPCGGNSLDRFGWVRARDGSVTFFQVNGQRTSARGINDAGMIVGFATDRSTGQTTGFVIKAPETNCELVAVDASELLQFPESIDTLPQDITNSGDVVGQFFDSLGNTRGFIATPQ